MGIPVPAPPREPDGDKNSLLAPGGSLGSASPGSLWSLLSLGSACAVVGACSVGNNLRLFHPLCQRSKNLLGHPQAQREEHLKSSWELDLVSLLP